MLQAISNFNKLSLLVCINGPVTLIASSAKVFGKTEFMYCFLSKSIEQGFGDENWFSTVNASLPRFWYTPFVIVVPSNRNCVITQSSITSLC